MRSPVIAIETNPAEDTAGVKNAIDTRSPGSVEKEVMEAKVEEPTRTVSSDDEDTMRLRATTEHAVPPVIGPVDTLTKVIEGGTIEAASMQ